ncbi:MAG: HAMP domain-containing histidine kinase [Anaerolineales bacterium]|nr:HAMP domain-containing histidine kinase [Anaerolineales bacterium]
MQQAPLPPSARIARLLAISKQLNTATAYGQRLQSVVDAAAELTYSQGSSILLFEEDTRQLYFAAVHSEKPEEMKTLRVPLDHSVAGWIYQQGQPLIIQNAKIDPLVNRSVEKSLGLVTHQLLGVPVRFGETVIGVLEVINRLDGSEYSQDDQNLLEYLAAYAGTLIQIQAYARADERVQREQLELEKQKTDFIAIASHELRTPLGLVLGHATFLREIIPGEEYKSQLDTIIRNAERLKEIIDSLNQVDNFQSGTARLRRAAIDLGILLQGVCTSLRREAEERQVAMHYQLPKEEIKIPCDPAKLSVAIWNVVKNGLVFTDPGGQVEISLEQLPGHAQVVVRDNGIGIPARDLHRIFERFYQVEPHLTRRHGGMGLGLSVSKAVIESHGGQIWVESTVGEGSAFTILLPQRAVDAEEQ